MEALYTAKLGNEEKGASLPDFKTKTYFELFPVWSDNFTPSSPFAQVVRDRTLFPTREAPQQEAEAFFQDSCDTLFLSPGQSSQSFVPAQPLHHQTARIVDRIS